MGHTDGFVCVCVLTPHAPQESRDGALRGAADAKTEANPYLAMAKKAKKQVGWPKETMMYLHDFFVRTSK